MGTSGLTMVKSNGKFKVAQYGKWDHYPSGQGFWTVKFINQPQFESNLFKEKVDALTEWEENELIEIKKKFENGEINNWEEIYPELLNSTGSDIFQLIYDGKVTKINNSIQFATNGLFCEWGWCINLDTNCLDCFKGFQKTPLSENQPFYNYQFEVEEYYPIKLISSIPFNQLSKFNTKEDFDDYIMKILDNQVMGNGIPKNWEDEI